MPQTTAARIEVENGVPQISSLSINGSPPVLLWAPRADEAAPAYGSVP